VAGVRSLGYIAESDLPGLYAGAGAFVLPSRYEGLGLPCLEAMACGVPVVAADRGALPETCGNAALLVDPDDGEAVAFALETVLDDETTRDRLRATGRHRAAEFSWDRAAAELHALLSELL
jgi:alpha-1,3-rhamnosyl/mannosyltransferase